MTVFWPAPPGRIRDAVAKIAGKPRFRLLAERHDLYADPRVFVYAEIGTSATRAVDANGRFDPDTAIAYAKMLYPDLFSSRTSASRTACA